MLFYCDEIEILIWKLRKFLAGSRYWSKKKHLLLYNETANNLLIYATLVGTSFLSLYL